MQGASYWMWLFNMPLGRSIHEEFLFLFVWCSMCGNRIRSHPFIDCFFVTVMTNLAWEGRVCVIHLWGKLSRNHGGMMLIGVLLISAQPAFLNSTGPAQHSTAQSELGLLYRLPIEKMPTDMPTGQSDWAVPRETQITLGVCRLTLWLTRRVLCCCELCFCQGSNFRNVSVLLCMLRHYL